MSACPGSGKTRVITERAARLIEGGFPARKLLCITFTNKAAQEMKQRLTGILGEQANEIYVSTFHALCLNILRKFGKTIGYAPNITVLADDDQESLMAQCARHLGYELTKQQVKNILYTCNDARENMLTGSEFEAKFRDNDIIIAREYISRMRKNNQVDFSGILTECVRLLETDKEIKQKLLIRFEMLQVDEAQDTNFAQFRMVELIGAHGNVFMVGDPDQSIYGWRGARYDNITDFIDKYKAQVIELPTNYRSTPEIVEAASRLIRYNEGREKAKITTVNKSGSPIKCFPAQDPDHEGISIARSIERLIETEGYRAEDFAILYRANAMSRALETALVTNGVPYQIIGSKGFYDRAEIKDVLAMLRLYANKHDGTALARFINKPTRGIGEVTLGKIEAYAVDKGVDLIEALSNAEEYLSGVAKKKAVCNHANIIAASFSKKYGNTDIGSVIQDLITDLNYIDYLEKKYEEDCDDRKANLDELINSASIYSSQFGNNISEYLNKIALMTPADKDAKAGMVTLMTMHASKGLEFPVVFLPRLEDGKMPHNRSLEERGYEEERRLFYVAMTRAEKVLVTSYSAEEKVKTRFGLQRKTCKPSKFLYEAGILKGNKYE